MYTAAGVVRFKAKQSTSDGKRVEKKNKSIAYF
jgi:hypothetical protein